MYHFQNSAPEDMCWLHQHSSTRPILDSDFDRRGWPNEQLQTEWRTPPRAPLPFNQRFGVCASVQPASLGWCGAIYTDQPETPSGLNSHTDAGIMASLAPCHPVSTPNRAPHFQYRTCLPQWQSLNQGPYRNSSQQSSHVHADHSMPCSSQGTFRNVYHPFPAQTDPLVADILDRHNTLLPNFASAQSHFSRTMPTLPPGRQTDLTPDESNPFAAPSLDLSTCNGFSKVYQDLQAASEVNEGCAQTCGRHSEPLTQLYNKAEPSVQLLPCNSEGSEHHGLISADLHVTAEKLLGSPDISSSEIDGSNSDEQCGRKCLPKPGRKKTKIDHITVAYLEEHKCFDMPLAEAAKSLDVGLSVMKRVCRALGLARWPYRTRASLQNVIQKTERYLVDQAETEDGETLSGQKANVIEALQSQMSTVTGRGGSDLKTAIKKYRQSIFKLNYKLKKCKSSPSARHKIAVPRNAAERVLQDQL